MSLSRLDTIEKLINDRSDLVDKLNDVVDPRRIVDMNYTSRQIKANQILQAIEQIDSLIKAIKPEKWD